MTTKPFYQPWRRCSYLCLETSASRGIQPEDEMNLELVTFY